MATMRVISRRLINPGEHQIFCCAIQFVGKMALGRGKFVGRKAAGLPASSETRNTRRPLLPKSFTFPCRATLHVLFDMNVSLMWTELSQWLPHLQANSYTGPPCPIQNAIYAAASQDAQLAQLIHAHHCALEAMVRAVRQSQVHIASSHSVRLSGIQGRDGCTYLW